MAVFGCLTRNYDFLAGMIFFLEEVNSQKYKRIRLTFTLELFQQMYDSILSCAGEIQAAVCMHFKYVKILINCLLVQVSWVGWVSY
jgi:hypothetical protein